MVGTLPESYPSTGYWGFAFDPYYDGGVMLGSEWGGRGLAVINATVHPTVATTLPAGGSAAGILVAGSPADVYVAAGAYPPGSDRITRFNASTLVPVLPIQLGTAPGAEVYDPNTGCMAVALRDTGQVLQVSVATGEVESAISVGVAPVSLAFDPVDGNVYVANLESGNVSILNATGVVATVPVGGSPSAVVADPGSGGVYVANEDNSTISVLSDNSVVRSFSVENNSGPDALAFDAATSRLFVVSDYLDNVSEYDPANGSLIGSFSVGANPVGITLDPNNQELYVANELDDNVSVISATILRDVANVSVGDSPGAISYDPANGLVYVADSGDDALSVIDPSTNTVLGTVAVGQAPGGLGGLAPDGPLGSLYVSNWLSGSLSVVATGSAAVAVEFGETGLPAGSLWTVTFNGSVGGSIARTTGPYLTFYAVNGTYAYAVAGPVGYAPHPASGTVRVVGRSLILPVQFDSNSTPVATAPATPLLSSTASYLSCGGRCGRGGGHCGVGVDGPPTPSALDGRRRDYHSTRWAGAIVAIPNHSCPWSRSASQVGSDGPAPPDSGHFVYLVALSGEAIPASVPRFEEGMGALLPPASRMLFAPMVGPTRRSARSPSRNTTIRPSNSPGTPTKSPLGRAGCFAACPISGTKKRCSAGRQNHGGSPLTRAHLPRRPLGGADWPPS